MASYTVLVILSAATFFSFTEQSVFRNIVNCPCGNSGENITIRVDSSNINDPCSKWANCKSCQHGVDRCLECPDGFEGSTCTIEIIENISRRKKRQILPQNPSPDILPKSPENRRARVRGDCRNLETPKGAYISCYSENGVKKDCTGKCIPGYSFENKEPEIELRCQNGVWKPYSQFPKCKSDGFCRLEMQGQGNYNCSIDREGTRCDVHCDNRLVGSFHCFPGQAWNPPLPSCIRPKGGESLAEVPQPCRCQNGGTCDPNNNCICPVGRTGQSCESITNERSTCDDPGFILNGVRMTMDGRESTIIQTFKDREVVLFGCRSEEYALQGVSFITCTDGVWSNNLPKCVKTVVTLEKPTCGDPGFVPNGVRMTIDGKESTILRTFEEGESVMFGCRSEEYAVQGDTFLSCNDGAWSNDLPKCVKTVVSVIPEVKCPDPGEVLNGYRQNSDGSLSLGVWQYNVGVTVAYLCFPGFSLQQRNSITCLESGSWSHPLPSCTLIGTPPPVTTDIPDIFIRCLHPPSVENALLLDTSKTNSRAGLIGTLNELKFPIGTRLQYSCQSTFELQGADILVCEKTGLWSAIPPSCSKSSGVSRENSTYCKHPGPVSNGKLKLLPRTPGPDILQNDVEYPLGTTLEISCNDGFSLVGDPTLSCTRGGNWYSFNDGYTICVNGRE